MAAIRLIPAGTALGPIVLTLQVALLVVYALYHLRRLDFRSSLLIRAFSCDIECQGATAVSAVVLIASAALGGWSVASRIRAAPYERPLVFAIVSLVLVAVPAAIVGGLAYWLDLPLLRPPAGPLLASVPAMVVCLASALHGRPPGRARWRRVRVPVPWGRPGLHIVVGALAATLIVISATISLHQPPTSWDALSYHAPLGVFLWREGDLGSFLDRSPLAWYLTHPAVAELWFGLLLRAGGERLADLGQLPFALLACLSVRAFSRRAGASDRAAWLAGAAWLLAPIVVVQIGMQLNDVIGAALLMATAALVALPAAYWNTRRSAIIGLGLGLTVTTKLALLPGVAGMGAFILVSMLDLAQRRGHWRLRIICLAVIALSFTVTVAPWWLRNLALYGNPVYPAALPLLGRGVSQTDLGPMDAHFVPHLAGWPLYPVIEPHSEFSGFGPLFAVAALPGLVLAAGRARPHTIRLFLAIALPTLLAWWTLTRHEPRFLLGPLGLAFAFIPWVVLAVPCAWRIWGKGALAAAAIVSVVTTLGLALVPRLYQPVERSDFYDRVWVVDPVVQALPDNEALLVNTGYGVPQAYQAHYPLLGQSLARLVVLVDVDEPDSMLIQRMRNSGARYAYVPAAPRWQQFVEMRYMGLGFVLEHVSTIQDGPERGTRRYLYRMHESEAGQQCTSCGGP